MKNFNKIILSTLLTAIFFLGCSTQKAIITKPVMDQNFTTDEEIQDNKIIIYQMLPRLFGNKNTTRKFYGSKEENGVGKFNDINDKAIEEIKKLSVSHVWYTGVVAHATMTDYSSFGIKTDDPDVVKGRAGSPYAIKDYYDVDADLAVDVKNRMAEFESLVKRTHQHNMKVIIDFVPNHVARTYKSNQKPAGVIDFGEQDDTTKVFDPKNDFYYIPGQHLTVPQGYNPGGDDFTHPLKDGKFDEYPAKATGNNVFSAYPSKDDWFETIKLNYGFDIQNNYQLKIDSKPPVWLKMKDILTFWANKGVDGFRCDMAEMIPVEFWDYVIPEIKKIDPEIIFIGEAYNSKEYAKYYTTGKFDFLYDKVGLYDGLKRLIKNEQNGDVKDISYVWREESRGFSSRMLRFLENHDEERIASDGFAQNPFYALPAMIVSATLSSGPVMIYMGQEVAEPAKDAEGFGGVDNRTSIFDYWGVPNHQKWMNNGAFDGALLSAEEKQIREFYQQLLKIVSTKEVFKKGRFYEAQSENQWGNKTYTFIRFTEKERAVVISNFNRDQTLKANLKFPAYFLNLLKQQNKDNYQFKNMFSGEVLSTANLDEGVEITVAPHQAIILSF